jgi:hypothetical protein
MARILPGGLTNIQNEFMKLRLQNNPEFAAEYFPNVVLNPPSGPLYDVDPSLNAGFNYPVKAMYEVEEGAAGPFKYLYDPYKIPTSAAEFRTENVPYDTPGSVLDVNPKSPGAPVAARAYTTPDTMYQGIDKGTVLPVTKGQSSPVYMMPEMIAAYGTEPKSPRNEMVSTPSWYPSGAETVDQADINKFIEGILGHEVSHNVSYLPEFKGSEYNFPATPESITGQAINLDFNKMFPPAASKEANKAIKKLGLLSESGGALGPATKEDPWGELINENIGYGGYKSPWITNLTDHEQEEVYNRAKDLARVKMLFPKSYLKHPLYSNNLSFLRHKFKKFPNQFPGENKVETYLKKVEPQVTQYFEKVMGQGGGGGWSPGVGATQRGSNAPGFTDPGKGSYGPWKADGGLATMFQRRQ